jgi:hypothetical protein
MKLPPLPTCNYGRDTFGFVSKVGSFLASAEDIAESASESPHRPAKNIRA